MKIFTILVLFLFFNVSKCKKLKIGIIGAGPAGLCALHHLKKNFPEAKIKAFELTEALGGVWRYSNSTENDEYGLPLMTAMYKNLRANLPKQMMAFPDFPNRNKYEPYMNHEQFLNYLNDFADNFDLKSHIKFRHLVTKVKPIGEKWLVKFKILNKQKFEEEIFDYVFVCNGHFTKYFIPEYEGQDEFKGLQIHSYKYRRPEDFLNKTVLTIGAGPSGIDISIDLSSSAKRIFFSHHYDIKSPFPENVFQKPDVERFTPNSVIFVDGTEEKIDCIVYCTGYSYEINFLDIDSGISVIDRKLVHPVYKHIVNIEHPTMFLIGLSNQITIIKTVDIQVRYCMALMKGDFDLPTKEAMLEYMDNYYEGRKSTLGFRKAFTHILSLEEPAYWDDLSEESGVAKVPKVISKMKLELKRLKHINFMTYRNYDVEIFDDENFTFLCENKPCDI